MPHPLSQLDPSYHARFGLIRPDLLILPMYAVVVTVSVGFYLDVEDAGWLPAAVVVGFSYYPIMRAIQLAGRRTALRVDAVGVTFGVPWPLSHRRTEIVPWSEVVAVFLWRQDEGPVWWRPYVGVQRRGGPSPVQASCPESLRWSGSYWLFPAYLTPQVASDRRRVYGWRLDRRRLATVVAQHAPHVSVVDLW